MSSFRVALQLYTIRQETERDYLGACEELAAMGYKWVELAGTGGYSALELKMHLSAMGLGMSGAHFPLEILDEPDRFADECLTLGIKSATLPGLPTEMRNSADAWRATGQKLESAAIIFRERGLRLGFHNHAVEFEMFDGKRGLDLLMAAAPSADMQLDMYWAAKAGEDPVTTTLQYSGRMPSVHFKDLGSDGKDIEFGHGRLDWQAILAACEQVGVETLVLEMDEPRHAPLESARMCLEGINRLLAQESRT